MDVRNGRDGLGALSFLRLCVSCTRYNRVEEKVAAPSVPHCSDDVQYREAVPVGGR